MEGVVRIIFVSVVPDMLEQLTWKGLMEGVVGIIFV